MPDPNLRALTALRRLRRVETDAARRDLSEALAREAGLEARDAAIGAELAASLRMTGDFDREMFSAWLARTRAERAALTDALKAAQADTAAARNGLARRRVAETAAEEALAKQVAIREADVARRDQVMLEDVARALRRAEKE